MKINPATINTLLPTTSYATLLHLFFLSFIFLPPHNTNNFFCEWNTTRHDLAFPLFSVTFIQSKKCILLRHSSVPSSIIILIIHIEFFSLKMIYTFILAPPLYFQLILSNFILKYFLLLDICTIILSNLVSQKIDI